MINWADIRKQFPVTKTSTYLNAAAAGPLSQPTMAAATEYYEQMMNDADTHWDEWLAKREAVRRKIARFINAEPDEIGLTTNTSSGMNAIVDALEGLGEVISCDLGISCFYYSLDTSRHCCSLRQESRGRARSE